MSLIFISSYFPPTFALTCKTLIGSLHGPHSPLWHPLPPQKQFHDITALPLERGHDKESIENQNIYASQLTKL